MATSILARMLTQVAQNSVKATIEINSAVSSMESLFDKAQGIQLGGSILAILAIITGAMMLVLGFKLLRVTLFVVGFVAGGTIIAIIAEYMFDGESWAIWASWVAFAIGGLSCGALVTWMFPLSTFIAGAASGIMLAMIVNNSVGNLILPGRTNLLLTLLCIVLGILFGVLALKVGKPILILSTSLFGAGMVAWGIGYFAGDFPDANDLSRYARKGIDGELTYFTPAAWWGYLTGIGSLSGLGAYIQFTKTALKVLHVGLHSYRRRIDVAEYVEKKTTRSRDSDEPDMEAQTLRGQRVVRIPQQPRQVVTVREVHEVPPQRRRTRSRAPSRAAPRRQYADLDDVDEIITYTERVPRQKRVVYSERESDLYEHCGTCGTVCP